MLAVVEPVFTRRLGRPAVPAVRVAAATVVAQAAKPVLLEPQILAEAAAVVKIMALEARAAPASSSSNTKSPQQLLYLPSNPRRSG
jgi:hypothetical protein